MKEKQSIRRHMQNDIGYRIREACNSDLQDYDVWLDKAVIRKFNTCYEYDMMTWILDRVNA